MIHFSTLHFNSCMDFYSSNTKVFLNSSAGIAAIKVDATTEAIKSTIFGVSLLNLLINSPRLSLLPHFKKLTMTSNELF
ncbi:hypothetical protein Peur_042525 [Populus x canadensis]